MLTEHLFGYEFNRIIRAVIKWCKAILQSANAPTEHRKGHGSAPRARVTRKILTRGADVVVRYKPQCWILD